MNFKLFCLKTIQQKNILNKMVVTTEMGINYKVCSYERLYRLFHPDTSETNRYKRNSETSETEYHTKKKKEMKEIIFFVLNI